MKLILIAFLFTIYTTQAAKVEFFSGKVIRGSTAVKDGLISITSQKGLYQYTLSLVKTISARKRELIVVGDIIELKKEPKQDSDVIYQLYEGTSVSKLSSVKDGYYRVRVFDEIGYLEESKASKILKKEILPKPIVEMTTTKGAIKFELLEDQTPNTVANFIRLVERSFYDSLSFHRKDDDFIIMAGDPEGTGEGGPGYFIRSEIFPDLKNKKGYVGMADSGLNTAGSQFYILLQDAPHLDGRYTVFARVIAGMDILPKLTVGDEILQAEVLEKRDHLYTVETISNEHMNYRKKQEVESIKEETASVEKAPEKKDKSKRRRRRRNRK
ncbi:MAG: peptidylprolyl isomerase [Candidatus Cloacimonetes bacterium]|nr:peptidylprolyl isomerase [Candidatus Cloacimonadota bacterium]